MTQIDETTIIPHRSKWMDYKDKALEWLTDTSTEIMSKVVSDRTNALFYTGLAFLVGLLLALLVLDRGQVEELAESEGEGLLGATIQSKLPPEDLLQPVPTNVNIVIIGDSISRYGYLSLVYFLRWGRWFEPELETNNLVNEKSFKTPFHKEYYGEFYFQTGRLIQPYELCDCYTGLSYEESPDFGHYIIENRYYHDPELNNSVTFIHAFGHQLSLHGRIPAEDAHNMEKWDWHKEEKKLLQHKYSKPVWSYQTWHEVLYEYVAKLDPKPEYAVVNAGQWSNKFGEADPETTKMFVDAMNDQGFKMAMWKTTTFRVKGQPMNEEAHSTDRFMCNRMRNCLDISWTRDLQDYLYWDDKHFYEPVYRVINEQMLDMMGLLPSGYAKYNREWLLKGGKQSTHLGVNTTGFTSGDEEDNGPDDIGAKGTP